MDRRAKIEPTLIIRLIGASIGAVGFFALAYQQTILGTSLVGIGSMIIAGAGS